MVRNLKKRYVILASLLVILFCTMGVSGQAESVTKNFTLTHFDVTFTFPKNVKPGDSLVVSVGAVAKSYIRVRDLSIQVLAYMEGGDLQAIGTASLMTDQYISTRDKFSKDLSVTVPTNTPRGELTAVFSETISLSSYSYYYYPSYYYYYGHYGSPAYYYWYYPYYYSYYYPDTSSQQYVESKVLPCSYVLATTPEYVKLKSDYDTLTSQYNDISTKYQQAMQQNKDLADKLNQATQDANNTRMLAYSFMAATVVLAVLAVILALYRRHRTPGQPTSSSDSGTSQVKPKKSASTSQ